MNKSPLFQLPLPTPFFNKLSSCGCDNVQVGFCKEKRQEKKNGAGSVCFLCGVMLTMELHTWHGPFVRIMLGHQNLLHTLDLADLLCNLKKEKRTFSVY